MGDGCETVSLPLATYRIPHPASLIPLYLAVCSFGGSGAFRFRARNRSVTCLISLKLCAS